MERDRSGSLLRHLAALALASFILAIGAGASTPRWTTGPPYFTVSNKMVVWYSTRPLYYTDPGDLSSTVNHAAADAIVAAAASIWNVPSALMIIQQGGTLTEHVSSANVYPGPSGFVFPADTQSGNYMSKQIAVIYDSDGSVTDLLLGGGASDPSGCRQNAVTESVDSITPDGLIQHALLILNGRCTGSAPEQQLQMQYQLERAFGRILGVGWSQLNDNVFTGTPQPTYAQGLHWPIMHPIDVVCGLYTYQCLPQAFTLRDDDIASITALYPVTGGTIPPGKQLSTTGSATLDGEIDFPTGQGMAGINLVLRRNPVPLQVVETFDDVSIVTGTAMQQLGATPVMAKGGDIASSLGSLNYIDVKQFFSLHAPAGYYHFPWIPIVQGSSEQDEFFRSEPINPLYTGIYAIGPYPSSTVVPSGDSVAWRINGVSAGYYGWQSFTPSNSAASCANTADGTMPSPIPVPASGWWTGVSCGSNASPLSFGHPAWTSVSMQGGRSLTVEVTAQDEAGFSTLSKMRPTLGAWSAADATGSAPSAAVSATAFNSVVPGMTSMQVQRVQSDTIRFAVSDERGDGRPDYAYQARVLYADTIRPATGTAGSQVTIKGVGFRAGNAVTLNGAPVAVTNWNSTTIVATVPFIKSVVPGATTAMDVVVSDLSTLGTTVMTDAFQYIYSAPVYTIQVISSPANDSPIGIAAAPAFVVKMVDVDGLTPLVGAPVQFTAITGSVTWDACSSASCSVLTDAKGLATIRVTPNSLGSITLQASSFGVTQSATFAAVALVRSAMVTPVREYLASGAIVTSQAIANFLQQGQPAPGINVSWSGLTGSMSFTPAAVTTNPDGSASAMVTAGPLASGQQVFGSACAWGGICASLAVQGVDPSQFGITLIGGLGQSRGAGATFDPIHLVITDQAGNLVAGAAVQIHQIISQWTSPCPLKGRCPIAPIISSANNIGTSDSNGDVVFTPFQIPGEEITDIVVTSGMHGFVSFTLQKQPI